MDEMADWEVNDIIECIPFLEKIDWERTRLEMYTNVQINSKKKLEPQDILCFPWDKAKDTSISNEDVDRLKNKAETLRKIMKK